jgi:IS30 family transposase
MATYKRLTLQGRYLIESLYQQNKTQLDIAQQIGVSQSTVCRGSTSFRKLQPRQFYDAQQAQQRAATARKRTPYKLKARVLTNVLSRLRDRLPTGQVVIYLRVCAARRHERYRSQRPDSVTGST